MSNRFRLCPKSKDCRWTTHFVQTIPSAVLKDIPGALSFTTLLPKSPGQLLHRLRKVFQAFRFLKPTRYEVPEQTARRQHGAAGRLSAEGYPQAAPLCLCAHLIRDILALRSSRKRARNLRKQSAEGRRGFCDLEESAGAA